MSLSLNKLDWLIEYPVITIVWFWPKPVCVNLNTGRNRTRETGRRLPNDSCHLRQSEYLFERVIKQLFHKHGLDMWDAEIHNTFPLVTWLNIPPPSCNISQFSKSRVLRKLRIVKTIASIWSEDTLGYLTLRVGHHLFLKVLGKLFAFRNRKCLRTILAYFRAKWRLLFVYFTSEYHIPFQNRKDISLVLP